MEVEDEIVEGEKEEEIVKLEEEEMKGLCCTFGKRSIKHPLRN